jgi:hypothetical protein
MKSITTPPVAGAPGSAIERGALRALGAWGAAGTDHAIAHVNVAVNAAGIRRVFIMATSS